MIKFSFPTTQTCEVMFKMILDSTSLPLDKILHSGFVKIQQGIAFKQLENYWYYVTARYFFYFEQEKKNPLGKEISRYPSKKKKN